LPILASEIERERARSSLEIGPYADAAQYFLAHSGPEELILAAMGFEKAQELAKARSAIERALKDIKGMRTRSRTPKTAGMTDTVIRALETKARILRADIREKQGQRGVAVAELRALDLSDATHPDVSGADARVAELSPPQALSKKERL